MFSLAVLGFITAGILLGLFGLTFIYLIGRDTKSSIKDFGYAYICVSVAFFIWGFAAFSGNKNFLNTSVLMGNALFFLGTLFLISTNIGISKNIKLAGFAAVATLFFVLRLSYFPPAPTMIDGILVFNTQLPIAIILGLMVLGVWLPVSIKVGRILANGLNLPNFSYIFSSMYVLATISLILFLAARSTNGLIISFIGLLISLMILLTSNFIIDQITRKTGRQISLPTELTENKIGEVDIKQPSYTINNVIALIFVILILIEWFWPRSYCSRSMSCPADLADLIIFPTMIFGVVAGISFLNRIIKLSKHADTFQRVLGLLVGGLGLFFFIISGIFSGLVGSTRGRPTV